MAVGLQRIVRRALLGKLKADTGLIALVPASSINPGGIPGFPFVTLSSPVTRRRRATGTNAGDVVWDIHAFAGPKLVDGAMTMTAEDHASAIGAAIETALADTHLALEGGGNARVRLGDIRLLPDESPDAFHWFAQVNSRVVAA